MATTLLALAIALAEGLGFSLLPSGMPSCPSYWQMNPLDAPIMILTLTSDTYSQGQLYDFTSS